MARSNLLDETVCARCGKKALPTLLVLFPVKLTLPGFLKMGDRPLLVHFDIDIVSAGPDPELCEVCYLEALDVAAEGWLARRAGVAKSGGDDPLLEKARSTLEALLQEMRERARGRLH